jgi:putative phage-type endonuclease
MATRSMNVRTASLRSRVARVAASKKSYARICSTGDVSRTLSMNVNIVEPTPMHRCLRCEREVSLAQYACSYECGVVEQVALPPGTARDRVVNITVPENTRLCGILQRTRPKLSDAEYFRDRQNFITASSVAALLGYNKHKTMRSALQDAVLIEPPLIDNRFVNAGRVHEPNIRALFAAYYNRPIMHNEGIVVHKDLPYLGATLDGLIIDECIPVEFKTIVTRKPGLIPVQYWIQVQIQIQCCDAPYAYYVEHDVEAFFSVTKIARDDVWFAAVEPDLAYLYTVITEFRTLSCKDRVADNGDSIYKFSKFYGGHNAEPDKMPYDFTSFNPRWEIKLSDPYQNSNVLIVNFLDTENRRLQFISPKLRLPSGIFAMDFPSRTNNIKQAIRTRTISAETKVRLTPKLDAHSPDDVEFMQFHAEIDEYVKSQLKEHGLAWIGNDAKFITSNLDRFFVPTVIPGGEYPDGIDFGVDVRNGVIGVPFFTEEGTLIENPMNDIENHSRIKVLYELSGFQFHKHTNKVKVLIRALEVKVFPPEQYTLTLASASSARPVCSF